MPEIRGEPSARNVAIVLCLPASNSRRTRAANSGSACSTSFHAAIAAVCAPPAGRTGKRTGKVLLVDGIHDLGGMQGFGAVELLRRRSLFSAHRWQAVARALLVIVAGAVEVSGGEFRHSIERMEPGHYLTSDYWEHWLTAAATLAVEHGLSDPRRA